MSSRLERVGLVEKVETARVKIEEASPWVYVRESLLGETEDWRAFSVGRS